MNNRSLYEKIMSGISNSLNEVLDDTDQTILQWTVNIEKDWEKLKKEIQNCYRQFGRPLDHELKWNLKSQWELLIKEADIIGYDDIELIQDDFDKFMDENDYKKSYCVVLLGRNVEYDTALLYRRKNYGWPKDFDRKVQLIEDYLTEGEAEKMAIDLNKKLSKKNKLVYGQKYIAISRHLVKK